jgi:hypothetical protein
MRFKFINNKQFEQNFTDEQLRAVKFADFLVVLATILIITTHFTTVFYVSHQSEVTKADYDKVVEVHETNPLAKQLLLHRGLQYIFSLIVIPSMIFTLYWVFRRTARYHVILFSSYLVFYITLFNLNNDIAMLLGALT